MIKEQRLIDVNPVIDKLTCFTPVGWGNGVPYIQSQWAMAVKIKDNFLKVLIDAPTVNAVEQKRGYWKGAGMGDYLCSSCWEVYSGGNRFNYCPNCGAKMDT